MNGDLIVSSGGINTFYIKRNATTEAFSTAEITFRVRDFEWQGNKSLYETAATVGANQAGYDREYDTANAGWVNDPNSSTDGLAALNAYKTATSSKYPPLSHPWYSGKDASGAFDAAEWKKVYSGSSIISIGHFILDLYTKDRATTSGLTGVLSSPEASRFRSVVSHAGRLFYAGLNSRNNGSKVYFSKVVESEKEYGECFQVNDPTSEVISDLLDTDGGYISLNDAMNIRHLHVAGSRLLVFAENGVWAISGVDDVFRATEYSVNKITDVGLVNVHSFVSAETRPYWWSATGIHTIVTDENTGFPREQNLSLSTIQSYWNSISTVGKDSIYGEYDELNRQVVWFYSSATSTVEHKANEVLILDEALQAFYPWRIADQASSTSYIVGTSYSRGTAAGLVDYTVIDGDGNTVLDDAGNTVIIQRTATATSSDSTIKLLVWDGATNKLTFAGFTGTSFLDWGDADYSSFAEAGYDFLGDMTLQKNAPFITVYTRVTETGWTGSELLGYVPARPSSCKVSSYWDFKTTASSSPQEAYRYKTMPVVDTGSLSTFGYPATVIATRLKMRGRGRSMRVRFESTTGKDFNLLGWEVVGARNGNL